MSAEDFRDRGPNFEPDEYLAKQRPTAPLRRPASKRQLENLPTVSYTSPSSMDEDEKNTGEQPAANVMAVPLVIFIGGEEDEEEKAMKKRGQLAESQPTKASFCPATEVPSHSRRYKKSRNPGRGRNAKEESFLPGPFRT